MCLSENLENTGKNKAGDDFIILSPKANKLIYTFYTFFLWICVIHVCLQNWHHSFFLVSVRSPVGLNTLLYNDVFNECSLYRTFRWFLIFCHSK